MKKKIWLFLIGAAGYCTLELCVRKRTHWSMGLAGGSCLLLIRRIASKLRKGIIKKCIVSSIAITGVELLCGLIWNRQKKVWDYSNMPLNYKGQICLPFSLLWMALSLPLQLIFKKTAAPKYLAAK